jgi:class 3 adenylate cyclase
MPFFYNLKVKSLILFIIFFGFVFRCSDQPSTIVPNSTNGILDLRDQAQWENSDLGFKLDGEWKFYWNEFLDPNNIPKNNPETRLMNVPSQWQQNDYPVQGYASYLITVLLPNKQNLPSLPKLGLSLPDVGSGYALYINGMLVSQNGTVGKSKSEALLYQRYELRDLSDFSNYEKIEEDRELKILMHISNFHYANAGLWNSIKFGAYRNIEREFMQKTNIDIIVFSALLIMGFYHIGLYLNRRKDKSPLYFGLFCILISIRTVSIQERLIFDVIPSLPFSIIHRIEFFTFYCGAFSYLLFIRALFKSEFSIKIFYSSIFIFTPAIFAVICLPLEVYVSTLSLIQIALVLEIICILFVVILAIRKKRTGARLFLLGLFVFASTIIIDILVANGLVHFRFLTSYGLLLFIVFQSVALSRKFAGAFKQAENLSDELQLLANSLELKVKERTLSLEEAMNGLEIERQKSEKLLLNIIPKDIATELKEKGFAEPTLFESVSVMFTDFKDFTKIAESMTPRDLINELEICFVQFDKITEKFDLEKLKTIGDSYMCAAGIPKRKNVNQKNPRILAVDSCLAGLEILAFMEMMKLNKMRRGEKYWDIRIGIHSGSLIAGVIGEKKFAYDVWGDTVNIASRMESNGSPSKINISGETFELIKDFFDCEYRGKINAKNKGEIDMYFIIGLKKEISKDNQTPNKYFWEKYGQIQISQ